MNIKHVIIIGALALAAAAIPSCMATDEPNSPLELTLQADEIMSYKASSYSERTRARNLYQRSLDELYRVQDIGERNFIKTHANAGLGLISIYDMVRVVGIILDLIQASDTADFDYDPIIPILQSLREDVFARTAEYFDQATYWGEDYSLFFHDTHLDLVSKGVAIFSLDTSGEWDMAELHLMRALTHFASVALQLILVYEDVFGFILDTITDASEGRFDMGHEFQSYFNQPGMTNGNPLLTAEFGLLTPEARPLLQPMQYEVGFAFSALQDAFEYMLAETDDQSDDYINRDEYLNDIMKLVAPNGIEGNALLTAVLSNKELPRILLQAMAELMNGMAKSAWGEAMFDPQQILDATLARMGLPNLETLLPFDLPVLDLAAYVERPLDNLKEILPSYYPQDVTDAEGNIVHPAGDFIIGEPESYYADDVTDGVGNIVHEAGDFIDVPHPHPDGILVDPPNGSDDPLYLYFKNASLNSMILKKVEIADPVTSVTLAPIDGGDTNRWINAIIGLVDGMSGE